MIGVEPSGQIVFANKLANVWFAPPLAPRLFSLVGAWSSDVLPESVHEPLKEVTATPVKPKDLRVQVKPDLTLQISCRAIMTGSGSEARASTVLVFATEAARTPVPG